MNRALTDEELLEIIDCNFRIALGANRKTREEIETEDLAERAMLEQKVQSEGGVSEEEAMQIAVKGYSNLLVRHPGVVFGREQIYNVVWKESGAGDCQIVMNLNHNIREMIEDDSAQSVYI